MPTERYFSPEFVASRKKVVKELRERAESPLPEPQADWGLIWVLSGPKARSTTENDTQSWYGEHQETGQRFSTGVDLARKVTARRLNKDVAEITLDDIKNHGPKIYFNGLETENEQLKLFVDSPEQFEAMYNFPVSNITITESAAIKHTGHQFDDFSQDVPDNNKVVVVTDLYHLPRIERYIKKYSDKFDSDKTVLYPSQPQTLPVRSALAEIKKIRPYIEAGILPPDTGDDEEENPA